jgi:DNA invertase Pin-like site-specific DNA recombinase
MNTALNEQHLSKTAYVYVRQSTLGQVRNHQESTERQYALRQKAMSLGWSESAVQILDHDLGKSGAQMMGREDFKTLVAEVSMGRVGAVFALEVSRLARSNLDWLRLLELCALTDTLVIDEDGCYNPADFNDGLLLGLKGTMAQAELHLLRGRLDGGKLNKAKKGELRFVLPVGMCHDGEGRIVVDPDEEVRGAVALVFCSFRETGSAYAVVQRFAKSALLFPRRAYGGAWDGKLIWGRLTLSRVVSILKNPSYAGVYVFGRYQRRRQICPTGEVKRQCCRMPIEEWRVRLEEHHEGYINWDEYLQNQERLAKNRTNGRAAMMDGPAREGLALLQGLLICGHCGRAITVRYAGSGGIYPLYLCNRLRREGLMHKDCLNFRCDLLDYAVAEEVLKALQPANLELAMAALEQLEARDHSLGQQWKMRLERAEYESALAERRYQEVDPAQRLVAATLEQRWNSALLQVEEIKKQAAEFQRQHAHVTNPEQKTKVLELARDLPRLWHSPTTQAKDRKRMLRLLIRDITVEMITVPRQLLVHIRWQGNACTEITIQRPRMYQDRVRYPAAVIDRVRELALHFTDAEIAEQFRREGLISAKGKTFTTKIIRAIRLVYRIAPPVLRKPEEMTVAQVAERFGVSWAVVYYWIDHGHLQARKLKGVAKGSPLWITMNAADEQKLQDWVQHSKHLSMAHTSPKRSEGGAL